MSWKPLSVSTVTKLDHICEQEQSNGSSFGICINCGSQEVDPDYSQPDTDFCSEACSVEFDTDSQQHVTTMTQTASPSSSPLDIDIHSGPESQSEPRVMDHNLNLQHDAKETLIKRKLEHTKRKNFRVALDYCKARAAVNESLSNQESAEHTLSLIHI